VHLFVGKCLPEQVFEHFPGHAAVHVAGQLVVAEAPAVAGRKLPPGIEVVTDVVHHHAVHVKYYRKICCRHRIVFA
jgi:hypothetical protein